MLFQLAENVLTLYFNGLLNPAAGIILIHAN